jgi:hypothetical protein
MRMVAEARTTRTHGGRPQQSLNPDHGGTGAGDEHQHRRERRTRTAKGQDSSSSEDGNDAQVPRTVAALGDGSTGQATRTQAGGPAKERQDESWVIGRQIPTVGWR